MKKQHARYKNRIGKKKNRKHTHTYKPIAFSLLLRYRKVYWNQTKTIKIIQVDSVATVFPFIDREREDTSKKWARWYEKWIAIERNTSKWDHKTNNRTCSLASWNAGFYTGSSEYISHIVHSFFIIMIQCSVIQVPGILYMLHISNIIVGWLWLYNVCVCVWTQCIKIIKQPAMWTLNTTHHCIFYEPSNKHTEDAVIRKALHVSELLLKTILEPTRSIYIYKYWYDCMDLVFILWS